MSALRKFRRIAAAFKENFDRREVRAGAGVRPVHFETLESRVLLSGDSLVPAPAIQQTLEATSSQAESLHGIVPVDQSVIAANNLRDTSTQLNGLAVLRSSSVNELEQQTQSAKQLVFVDPAVQDYNSLVAQIADLQLEQPSLEIHLLDPTRDGIDQITEVLSTHSAVAAVHIFSHGATGFMQVGDSYVDQQTVEQKTEQLASWKNSLSADGDILLYGCSIAEGETGVEFVKRLGEVTGADISASTNKTGSAQLGGNWLLEYNTGTIEATSLALQQYDHLLQDFVSDSTSQTFVGSDSGDSYIFKNGWGADSITDAGTSGIDLLDFSQVTANLTFTLHINGTVSVTDGTNTLNAVAGMESIKGGSGSNLFVFEDGAVFAGTLDGGTGTTTLDYSQYSTAVSLNLATGAATGTAGIKNIDAVIGGTANDTISLNSPNVSAKGGGGSDTFVFQDNWGTVTLTDISSSDTLDFSQVTKALTFTFSLDGNIKVSDGTDTLACAATVNAIKSGSGDDSFIFENGASFSGAIDGGSGTNTLDYSAYLTPVLADLASGTVTTGGTVISNGVMSRLSVATPLNNLNSGSGVNLATLTSATTRASLGINTSRITTATSLSSLNNGQGVRTVFGNDLMVLLSNGVEIAIDLSSATTVGDVITAINNSDTMQRLTATINTAQNGLVIADNAGGTGSLVVINRNGSTTATDLGLDNIATGYTLNGRTLVNDLLITLTDQTQVSVSLSDATTLQEMFDRISSSNANLSAQLNTNSTGIIITDASGGTDDLKIENLNSTATATALGIAGTGSANSLNGQSLLANMKITLSGGSQVNVNLGNAATLQDVITAIHAADSRLVAAINVAGTGIDLTESGSSGSLTVSNLNGCTAATGLGIAGIGSGGRLSGSTITTAVASTSFSNIANIIGGSADDRILGSTADNILVGGAGADTFVVTPGWGVDAIADFGTNGIDTLDLSTVTSDLTFTLHADGTVSVTDGTNLLSKIEGLENLIGGSGNNRFIFEDGADFGGMIDGGTGGTNLLDYSAYSSEISVDLVHGTATGTTGIKNIQNISGGAGDDVLIGSTAINAIRGNDGDDLIDGAGGNDSLIGGAGYDTYLIDPATGTVTITEAAIDGDIDTLDYSGSQTAMTVNLAAGVAPGTTGVANVENVIGGSAGDQLNGTSNDDVFSVTEDWGNDTIIDPSSTDSDMLNLSQISNDLTFQLRSDKTTSVTDGTNTINGSTSGAANIEQLIGGSGDDTFVFNDGWGSYAVISGGQLDTDILDFSQVTKDLTFTFHEDGTVSVVDAFGNSLISAVDIDKIIGGSGNNRYLFEDKAVFNGFVDGGTGVGILDYSAYHAAVTVNLGLMDELTNTGELNIGQATGVNGINRIDQIIGGLSTVDCLIGFNSDTSWNIAGSNSGTINSSLSFSGVELLVGQNESRDTFTISNGGSITSLVGGTEKTEALDTITFAASNSYSSVSYLVTGSDSGAIRYDSSRLNYAGIEAVVDDATASAREWSYLADHTASIAFSGAPETDQVWTIKVDGVPYSHTVASKEWIEDIVGDLANKINAVVGGARYLASALGNTLVISSLTDSSVQVTTLNADKTSTLPNSASAAITYSDTPDAGIRLGRDDESGRLDIASLNGTFGYFSIKDPTSALSIKGGSGNDVISIGQFAKAESLNISIDGKGGTDRITYDLLAGPAATVDSTPATTSKISFSGTPVTGEQWTVTIDGTDFSYTVISGQTVTQVISQLAAQINQTADYAASVEANSLAIVKLASGTLAVSTTLLSAATPNVLVANPTTTQITLTGALALGETWTVTVDGVAYSHTVTAGQTLGQVVTQLASTITSAYGLVASVNGTTITISKLTGEPLSVTSTRSSSITPILARTTAVGIDGVPVAGEVWNIKVNGIIYSHTVLTGEDWAAVVGDLATQINAVSGYTATTKDHYLMVTQMGSDELTVSATLLAAETAVITTTDAKTRLVLLDGVPQAGDVWTVVVGGTNYTHTVSGYQSLAQVISDLTSQINNAAGFSAACKGSIITVTALSGGVAPVVTASAPTARIQDLKYTANSISLDNKTVVTYSNIENARNLIFVGTGGSDQIALNTFDTTRFKISSSNSSFGDITFDAPDAAGSLTINAGKGDDSVTINTSFSPALSLKGGGGTDSLNLGAATNTFSKLAFGSDFSTVTGGGSVEDFVFNAYGAEDSIAFGYLSGVAIAGGVTTLGLVPGVGAVALVAGAVGTTITDVVRRTPNQVEVTRITSGADTGKIQISDTNWLHSSTVVLLPTKSLTINTGLSYLGQDEHVNLNNIGTLNADLTVNCGSLDTNDWSFGTVTVTGDLILNGRDLNISAENITIQNGATVSTSNVDGAAGDITLNGHSVVLKGTIAVMDNTTAVTTTVALAGTPAAGQAWSITVGTATYTHTVLDGQDLAAVATALANAVNAASGYAASVEGSTISLTKLAVLDIVASVPVTASVAIENVSAMISKLTFAGSLVVGQSWSVTVDGKLFTHKIATNETLADVTTAFETLMNAEGSGLTASLDSGKLVVTKKISAAVPAGVTATVNSSTAETATVLFGGSPVHNQVWDITVNGTVISHTIGAGETLFQVLGILANDINSLLGYTAAVEENRITIVKLDGAPLTVTTTMPAGAKLLAIGKTSTENGDILINAVNDTPIVSPLVDVDVALVEIQIGANTTISGKNVTLNASINNEALVSKKGGIGGLYDKALSILEGLMPIEFAASVIYAESEIDIQAGANITSSMDFTAVASNYSYAATKPLLSFIAAPSASIVISSADIQIAGNITTGRDLIIRAATDQTVKTISSPAAIKGITISTALSVIISRATAVVTDDAVLHVGRDLFVLADNTDRVLTKAASISGTDGVVGAAIAATVEIGTTTAYLEGTAIVGGDVVVAANMVQDMVPIKKMDFGVASLPSSSVGTSAVAGTGSNSSGDVLEDTYSAIISPVVVVIKDVVGKIVGEIKQAFGKKPDDSPDPPADITSKVDLAGSIAFVFDMQTTTARIGDGNSDGDNKNGLVDAAGAISVTSLLCSAPYVSASAYTANNPDTKKAKKENTSVFSGSLAASAGVYLNTANAYINSLATVDAGSTLTVDAETLSDYEFSWGLNLITPWLETATYTTSDANPEVTVHPDTTDTLGAAGSAADIVEISEGFAGKGDVGTWYEYIGDDAKDINLQTEDFTDTTQWRSINPIKKKFEAFGTTLVSYLSGDAGFSNWISNTWSQATAAGEKVSVAGAITFLELENHAEATIKSGALVNQKDTDTFSGDQDVVVFASSHNDAVNLGGNINLPSITLAADKAGTINLSKLAVLNKIPFLKKLPGVKYKGLSLDTDALKGGAGTEGKGAVGFSFVGVDYAGTAIARIEDGVKLHADTLQVNAENQVLGVNVGASGGKAETFGFNGMVGLNLVRNQTIAQIENGALIDVGSGTIFDPLSTPAAQNAAVIVGAKDTTYAINALGGVAVSESVGVGASVGVNIVLRDTQAVIGDLYTDTTSGTKGSFSAGGNVQVTAENAGFVGSLVVAGGVGSSSDTKDDNTGGSSNPGTGGTQGSDGSAQSDKDLQNWQGKAATWLEEMKNNPLFQKVQKANNVVQEAIEKTETTKESKNGIGLSGSVAVNVIKDDARAYIRNSSTLTIPAGTLTINAENSTSVGSISGSAALGKGSDGGASVGLAGAFSVNVLLGVTEAYIDGATSLNLKGLDIEAARTGWNVSIAAGLGGAISSTAANSKASVGIGGSVGVNVSVYSVEAGLRNTTGTVSGNVKLNATNELNQIAIGGAVGFGGSAGFGIALGFSYSENTVRSQVSNLTSFSNSGTLDVLASSGGVNISVTGSLGVAADAKKNTNSKGAYSGAGTASLTISHNTVVASIDASSMTGSSAVTLDALDTTTIVTVGGGVAIAGTSNDKAVAIGAAIAINISANEIKAGINNSKLTSTGAITVTASEAGSLTVVTIGAAVSVATGTGKGTAGSGAGSVSLNVASNKVSTYITDCTGVGKGVSSTGGAVTLKADDALAVTAVAGSLAVSVATSSGGSTTGAVVDM